MVDEPEEEGEPCEIEFVQPEPVSIADGEMLILDPEKFAEEHNTNVVRMTGSQVWVLDNDTRKWRDIEVKAKRGGLSALPAK